jgi:hypothetical protein
MLCTAIIFSFHYVHRLFHDPRTLITLKILAGVVSVNLSLQFHIPPLRPSTGLQILSIFILP